MDFRQPEQARKTINDWVAKQTKDKIKDLIARGVLTADTRLVLTNAMYFKSNWAEQIREGGHQGRPFQCLGRQVGAGAVDAPAGRTLATWKTTTCSFSSMPYMQGELSMVVLLPRKVDGLAELEKSLTADNLGQWLKDNKHEYGGGDAAEVHVHQPVRAGRHPQGDGHDRCVRRRQGRFFRHDHRGEAVHRGGDSQGLCGSGRRGHRGGSGHGRG